MATLKICTFPHTTWIPNVSRLDLLRVFTMPETPATEKEADPWFVCFGDDPPKNPAYTADFTLDDKEGKLLRVYVGKDRGPGRGEPQLWVVPLGSSFLMGDDGKTIDKV